MPPLEGSVVCAEVARHHVACSSRVGPQMKRRWLPPPAEPVPEPLIPLAAVPIAPRWLWYLHASDDGVMCPAHVGQRGALHLDLHGLDGPCGAQISHSYLQHMRP